MFGDFKYINQILLKPSSFFERAGPQDVLGLFRFFANISILLFAELLTSYFLSSLVSFPLVFTTVITFLPTAVPSAIVFFIGFYFIFIIAGFLFMMISSGIIHVFAYLFGCKGYKTTLTAIIIGFTPVLAFGGIPVIGLFTIIYSFVLQVIGLSKLHKIPRTKAFTILVMPVVIVSIFLVLSTFIFLGWLISSL